jgi:transposase-like protein
MATSPYAIYIAMLIARMYNHCNSYLDNNPLRRKTGTGAQRWRMLVALGVRPDGRKEMIDFRQVAGESKIAWEGFLNHLCQRRLKGDALKLISWTEGKGFWRRSIWSMAKSPFSGVRPIRPAMC